MILNYYSFIKLNKINTFLSEILLLKQTCQISKGAIPTPQFLAKDSVRTQESNIKSQKIKHQMLVN